MEKIFIAIDTPLQNRHLSNLQALTAAVKEINEAVKDYLGSPLDKYSLNTIINYYPHYVNEVVKQVQLAERQNKKVKYAIDIIISGLSSGLEEELEKALSGTESFNKKDYLKFIELHANGNPYIVDSALHDITVMSSIYADTPEKIAFHNKHLEAVKILNALNDKHFKAFGSAVNGLNPLITLFEVGLNNSINARELDYRS
jgi:hypothetical protein